MKFRLCYDGPIKGNGRKSEGKDRIRTAIARQLDQVWRDNEALADLLKYDPLDHPRFGAREVNGRFFRPLVVESLRLRCELDVLILAAQRSISVVHAGDLDNRIKTLIDGLRLPTLPQETSAVLEPNTSLNPYNVLLEDDRLISRLSAQSDVLLGSSDDEIRCGFCRVVIHVHVFPISPTMDAFSLIG